MPGTHHIHRRSKVSNKHAFRKCVRGAAQTEARKKDELFTSQSLKEMLAVVLTQCPCDLVRLIVVHLYAKAFKVSRRHLLHQHFHCSE